MVKNQGGFTKNKLWKYYQCIYVFVELKRNIKFMYTMKFT